MQKLKSVVFVNFFTVFVWKKGSAGNLSAAMAKRKATYYSGRFEMREEWVCASPEEYDKGRLRIDYDQIIAKRGQLHRRHRPNFVFKRFFILEQVEPIAIDLDSNGTAVVGVGQCCYSCCEKPVFEMFQHKMSCFEFLIPRFPDQVDHTLIIYGTIQIIQVVSFNDLTMTKLESYMIQSWSTWNHELLWASLKPQMVQSGITDGPDYDQTEIIKFCSKSGLT